MAMKFLILTKIDLGASWPKDPVANLQASADWLASQRTAGKVDFAYSIPPGGGALVLSVDSHEEMNQILLSYPGIYNVTVTVYPLADAGHAFASTITHVTGTHLQHRA